MSFRKRTYHGPNTGALPKDEHLPFKMILAAKKAANDAIKRSEMRMAANVKFTPKQFPPG